MAEGGGENLGLAQLELTVDQAGLTAGLKEAAKRISEFSPIWNGVQSGLKALAAQIEATLAPLGDIRVGAGAPAPGGTTTTGRRGNSTSASGSAPGIATKEERNQTRQAEAQTEEQKKQTALLQRGIRAPGVTVEAPQVFRRSLATPQISSGDTALQQKTLQALQGLRVAREELNRLQRSRPRTEAGKQQKLEETAQLEAKISDFEQIVSGLNSAVEERQPKPGVRDVIRSDKVRRAPTPVTTEAAPPVRGGAVPSGSLERSFAALKATCEQLQACFTEFLPACKEAAAALRELASGAAARGGAPAAGGAQRLSPANVLGTRPKRPITPSSEDRLLRFADAAAAPDSNVTLRRLRRARGLLLEQREGAVAGSDRSQRLTDSINRLSTRIDRETKVGRTTQGVQGIRANARERLLNFEGPARAQLESLQQRGAPRQSLNELQTLFSRVVQAQTSGEFGLAERLRNQFESRRRTVQTQQTTTERTSIRQNREQLDESRTTKAIKDAQLELNVQRARGVDISKAQLTLDKASEQATQGRRQEARDTVAEANRQRRAASEQVRLEASRAREERTRLREKESARGRSSGLDRSIRQIEQNSPEFLRRAGVNPQLLRRDLGAVREAQAQGTRTGDFESAKSLGAELKRKVRAALDKIAAFEQELETTTRNAPKVSVRGRAGDVGSPAFVQRGARQGGARESINSPEVATKKVFELENKINALQERGADVSAARNRLQALSSAQSRNEFGTFRNISNELDRQVKLLEIKQTKQEKIARTADRELTRLAKAGGPTEPVRGRKTLEDSPAGLVEKARQQREADRRATIPGFSIARGDKEGNFRRAENAINSLEFQGSNVEEFKSRLRKARKDLEDGNILAVERGLKLLSADIATERTANTSAKKIETLRNKVTTQLKNIEELQSIGGNTEEFKARLAKAEQNIVEKNVSAAESELNRLAADIPAAKSRQREVNRSAPKGLAFNNAQQALSFAPRIETPAQLKEYEAALKKLVAQTAVTDDAFDPLQAVLKRVSAALKSSTTDAAALAGALKGVREEAARVKPPQLGAPLPPPRPGAPPPPPRVTPEERRRALEAQDAQRRRPPAPLPPPPPPRRLGLIEQGRALFDDKKFRERASGALSSGLIGGGFPLLFGQGAGAGLGGLLGGIGGGALGGGFGFGASIVGTLIGSTVDALVQRFGTLAKALQDPIASLDTFIQSATLASAAQERYVQALIDAGRTAEASQIIRGEAGRTIDPTAAALAANAQDNYARALSDTQDLLGNIVAGPATGFLNFLTDILRIVGFRPSSTPRTVTGADAVDRAQQQQQKGSFVSQIGGLVSQGGFSFNPIGAALGLGIGAVGAGNVAAGDASERVANAKSVKDAEDAVTVSKQRQIDIENQINVARSLGKADVVSSLEISKQIATADERRRQAILEADTVYQSSKKTAEDTERYTTAVATATNTASVQTAKFVSEQQGSTAQAQKQLAVTQRLVGLSGDRLQIEQSRIAIEAAARSRDDANQQLRDVQVQSSKGTASTDEVNFALARQKEAEANYTRVVIEESEKRRRAVASEAAQRLENAAALERVRERSAIADLGPSLNSDGRQAIDAALSVKKAYEDAAIAQARLQADPGNPQLLGAAQIATANVTASAKEARNLLQQAYKSVQDALQAITRNIEDAVLKLSELQGTNQGVNRFLGGQALANRQQAQFSQLLPQFLSAREDLARRQTDPFAAQGIRGINFSGNVGDVNRSLIDFIRSAREEIRAQQDTERLQVEREALVQNANLIQSIAGSVDINTALNASVAALGTVVADLAAKNWTVSVNVPGGTASGDVIGAVNNFS